MFEKRLFAGWGDMDFNSHMRNTAYLDKSGDVRMMFFAEHGFPMSEFMRLRIGPVVMKDEVEYFKEVGLLEEMTVSLALAGLSMMSVSSVCAMSFAGMTTRWLRA